MAVRPKARRGLPAACLPGGRVSTRFITNENEQLAVLSNPLILVSDAKIHTIESLLPLLEQVSEARRSLLIIADNVEGEALEILALNKEKGTLLCAAVRAPQFEMGRQLALEDIAVATGGTVISAYSTRLQNVRLIQLGSAERVEVSQESTWILGGRGKRESIAARAAAMRRQAETASNDFEREKLRERLAKLVGKVCEIRVGGASSVEAAERMYKVQSALYSAQAAVSYGMLPGGGTAFFKIAQRINTSSKADSVVAIALERPLVQQIQNARRPLQETLAEIKQSSPNEIGFNAESRRVENLGDMGILDATRVCVSALQKAFVHARAILQTGSWDLTQRSPRPDVPAPDASPG